MHEWKKKLNRLLKICSEGILPRTAHIQDPYEGTAQVGCFGGSATVFKCLHNGAKVAVKVINAQISSFGNAFRVSAISMPTAPGADRRVLGLL